jgi:hypothetical protein
MIQLSSMEFPLQLDPFLYQWGGQWLPAGRFSSWFEAEAVTESAGATVAVSPKL